MKTSEEDIRVAWERGDVETVRKMSADLLQADARSLTAHFHMMLCDMEAGNYDRALHHGKKVLEMNDAEPNIYLNLGVLFTRTGDLVKAKQHYEMELLRDPYSGLAHYNLGLLLEKSDPRLATAHYEQSFKLGYNLEATALNLSKCYYDLGLLNEEIEVYKKFLEQHPENTWARSNLGAAYIDSGEKDKALLNLSRAKRRSVKTEVIDRNIESAKELPEDESHHP